jgi:hypothetical protein
LSLVHLGRTDDRNRRLAETVARESQGNPFFVMQLVQHLKAEIESGREPVQSGVTLEQVLQTRITSLPPDARRLLEVVAVAGRPMSLDGVLAAAELPARARGTAGLLRTARLLRGGAGDSDLVEAFHDRVRETILTALPPEILQTTHLGLAVTLEASGAEPEVLAVHFAGAGQRPRAGALYIQAADLAAESLAFDHAAKLYRLGLELSGCAGRERLRLRTRLADVLANSGRQLQAAEEYLIAAPDAEPAVQLDLRGRAASQLLQSGYLDRGFAMLKSVLTPLGMPLATTTRRAAFLMIMRRLYLRWRGLDFKERSPEQISSEERVRLDLCIASGSGISIVDPVRASEFATRVLLRALDKGSTYQIARALFMQAAHISTGGTSKASWAAELLSRGEELARRLDLPVLWALSSMINGIAAFHQGRWRDGLRHADEAAVQYRTRCVGVAWQQETIHIYGLWCLTYMGGLAELTRRREPLLEEVRERGNLYAMTFLSTYIQAMVRLAADDPKRGRADLEAARHRWIPKNYGVQQNNFLLGEVWLDLYEGDGDTARRRLAEGIKRHRETLLWYNQHMRVDLLHLDGRAALAAAVRAKDPRPMLLAAEGRARQLHNEQSAWTKAKAILIRACCAAIKKEPTAVTLFGDAVVALEGVDMSLAAAAARRRQGELLGGDEGRALIHQADEWMTREEIRDPARMTAALAPYFT